MQVILRVDQRQKQNHKDEILPALPQELYLLVKEFGPMLNQENIQSPILKCRRIWLYFVMEVYPEKMMERLNSGESKTIFRNISSIVIIGLTKNGRKAWQEEEETWKYTSIVLIHQEQYCTSELFKVIQDAIPLILLYRTMFIIPDGFFQYIHHIGCAINSHSIINSGLIPVRSKFEQSDRQYSFCLWIPRTKTTKILIRSTWMNRVMHNTCIKHGRSIRIRCIWVDINLALKKGLKFYQTRSNAIILHETLPAYCIPKVVRTETGEVIIRESIHASPRLPPQI